MGVSGFIYVNGDIVFSSAGRINLLVTMISYDATSVTETDACLRITTVRLIVAFASCTVTPIRGCSKVAVLTVLTLWA